MGFRSRSERACASGEVSVSLRFRFSGTLSQPGAAHKLISLAIVDAVPAHEDPGLTQRVAKPILA